MVCSRSRLLTGSASTRWFFFFFGRKNVCSNASILIHSGGDGDPNTVNATLGRRHAKLRKARLRLNAPGAKGKRLHARKANPQCRRRPAARRRRGHRRVSASAREAVPATGRAAIERQGADRRPVHAHRSRPARQVTDKDYRGRYMLVFFGFTGCPDICPAGLQLISAALDKVGAKADNVDADLHQRRSRARHAREARRLREELQRPHRRSDRHAGRSRRRRQSVSRVLREDAERKRRPPTTG